MPIKGLSDKSSITPRFPRLGKLRKGGERVKKINKSGKEVLAMGVDLDHFRFTSDDPKLVEIFNATYGDNPRSIMVYLPYANADDNFPTWCELWNASGLVHRCDGENMIIWQEGGKFVKGSKPCPGGHKDNDAKRDSIGRLNVIIPELLQAGYVGYITMETHSINDIVSISSVLAETLQQRGDNPLGLRGIQFVIRRIKENISVPGWGDREGQRSRTDKWLVRLEPAVEWVKLQLELDRKTTMLLPGGGTEEDDIEEDQDDIEEDLPEDDDKPDTFSDAEFQEIPEADLNPEPEPIPLEVQAAMKREIINKTTGEKVVLETVTDEQLDTLCSYYNRPNVPLTDKQLAIANDLSVMRKWRKEHSPA